jgi:TPR repeat protein
MKVYGRYGSASEKQEMLRWARIAAENGSPQGHYEYGQMLSRESDDQSKLRAIFHLRIAADAGSDNARMLLENLEQSLGVEKRAQ